MLSIRETYVLWRFGVVTVMPSAILQRLVRLLLIIGVVLSFRHSRETMKSKNKKPYNLVHAMLSMLCGIVCEFCQT